MNKESFWSKKWNRDNYYQYHKNRFNYFIKTLPKISKGKILDFGASDLTLLLKSIYMDSEVICLDLDSTWKNRLIKENIKLINCDLKQIANGYKLPFKNNEIDLIVFSEIIEHINTEMGPLMSEFYRILKKKGYLVISTPNYGSLINRIKMLFGINPTNLIIEKDQFGYMHVREYTMTEMDQLMKYSKFKVIFDSYPMYFDRLNRVDNLLITIKKILIFPIIWLLPPLRKAMFIIGRK